MLWGVALSLNNCHLKEKLQFFLSLNFIVFVWSMGKYNNRINTITAVIVGVSIALSKSLQSRVERGRGKFNLNIQQQSIVFGGSDRHRLKVDRQI